MNTDRIQEIQKETAYPDNISVQQALLKVWNETGQEYQNQSAIDIIEKRIGYFTGILNKPSDDDFYLSLISFVKLDYEKVLEQIKGE